MKKLLLKCTKIGERYVQLFVMSLRQKYLTFKQGHVKVSTIINGVDEDGWICKSYREPMVGASRWISV